MTDPPRPPKEPVINADMAIGIAVVSVVDAIAILLVFYLGMQRYPGHASHIEAAQTMAFITLCTSELLRAFTARSERHSVFTIGVFSNPWMVWATTASFLLVLLVTYVPFLQPFFDTIPLSLGDWFFMLPFFSPRRSRWNWSRSTSGTGTGRQKGRSHLRELNSFIKIPLFLRGEEGAKKKGGGGIDALISSGGAVWLEIVYEGEEIAGDLRERLDEATTGTGIEILWYQKQSGHGACHGL